MTTEDFLEKFPSLQSHITPAVQEKNILIRAAWVNTDNIQKFCLDRAKVKEVIEKTEGTAMCGASKKVKAK